MVNYTHMYMVYAVCKHACVHMCTVRTIYAQPHIYTDRQTDTNMHTYRYIYNTFSSHHKHRKQTFTTKYVLT